MEIETVLALAFDDASSCHMVIKEYCAKVCLQQDVYAQNTTVV